ncbi:MAG: threonylcarbamoyl-AMP synthase [Bacilli bacterium]|nr:threonylcarbamoyl-AMP synthase [Bacilli bacterium]
MDKELLNVLQNGKLAILPSDTVYGIFADATNYDAIKRVDEAKHSNKPHLIVISSIDMLKEYVSEINELQEKIINKYWPNTLTILFKKNDKINDELTKGSEYIGIRMPKNDWLLRLIDEFGKPLISSSANITNEKVITNVKMLDKELKKSISYIYDDGDLSDIASTLIKVEDNKIIFLREGILANKIKEDFKEYI